MKYRPEIDGLRAIAVVPVLAFHAGEKYFPKGYLGVDIFFVISGFLISSIILAEIENKNFSLINFYSRRAKRILPALFFVIFCTIPFACWFIYSPQELMTFSQSVVAGFLFVANFFYYSLFGDYFAPDSKYQPLLHLWSLAVEEQFYLFFPFLLILLAKTSRQVKFVWLGVLSFASFVLNMILARFDPLLAFYMLPTRFWELTAGSLIAVAALDIRNYQKRTLDTLSLLGMGLIIGSYSLKAFSATFLGILPLILGVCLILAFARKGTIIARFLSLKGLVGIGLISYSLYLWHQPIFTFARFSSFSLAQYSIKFSNGGLSYLALSLLAVALAIFTYHYVEQPWRRKFSPQPRHKILYSRLVKNPTLLFAFLIAAGFSLSVTVDIITKTHSNNVFITDPHVREVNWGLGCHYISCSYGDNPQAILIGDSFAAHLATALITSSSAQSFTQLTGAHCPPAFDYVDLTPGRRGVFDICTQMQSKIKQHIIKNDDIDYVIISSRFNYMVDGSLKFATDEGERQASMDLAAEKIQELITYARLQGKKPIIVSSTPRNGSNSSRCLELTMRFSPDLSQCNMTRASVISDRETQKSLALMQKIEGLAPILYLHDFLCDEDFCQASIDDYPLYIDQEGHMTIKGSELLGQKIDLFGLIKQRADSFAYPE